MHSWRLRAATAHSNEFIYIDPLVTLAKKCDMKRCAYLLIAMVFTLFSGCKPSYELETAVVTGYVTLDGNIIDKCTVLFVPAQGRAARGLVKSDGTFSLSTYGADDGAIVGTHRAAVFVATGEGADNSATSPLIPDHYATPATSGLVYEVRSNQNNDFYLDLKSKSER